MVCNLHSIHSADDESNIPIHPDLPESATLAPTAKRIKTSLKRGNSSEKIVAIKYKTNVIELSCRSIMPLMTKIRDKTSTSAEFSMYSRRLLRVICEEAIGCLATIPYTVMTPTGTEYTGLIASECGVVGVSIIRSGDAMLEALQSCLPDCSVGKILIQRDEVTATPVFMYKKLPADLSKKHILLLDPMLATGGSAKLAIQILLENGADVNNILFVNVVSCPEGIDAVLASFPDIRIVTAAVDTGLNNQKYILPGLGDFGDRFYGT